MVHMFNVNVWADGKERFLKFIPVALQFPPDKHLSIYHGSILSGSVEDAVGEQVSKALQSI